MQARPPAAQGFQTRRAWQRGRPPAGSGHPVPREMGLSHKSPRQTTGNRPSNEARTASFKGRYALWFPFFVRAATAFSFAGAPRGRHAAPRAAVLPQKGKRSEPGQAAPAPRPLSIPRFFLSPSAPPESKPRGAHAGHGGQQPRAGQRRRTCHAGHGRSLCAFHRVDNGKTGRLVPLDAQADQRAARHKAVPVPIGNAFHDLPHRIGAGPSGRVMALEVLKDALPAIVLPEERTRPSIFSSPSVPR